MRLQVTSQKKVEDVMEDQVGRGQPIKFGEAKVRFGSCDCAGVGTLVSR